MDLSIILCTRNRPDVLASAVHDVHDQLGPGDELLVVDQSDPEAAGRVAAIVASWQDPRLRLLPDDRRGLPRARNLGLAATDRPLVLFLDDDVRLLRGCLDAHRAIYRDPWVGGAVGRILERSVRPNAPRTTNHLGLGGRVRTRLDGQERVDVATLKGANMSFRRAALRSAGACDEGYDGTAMLEDADWSTRVAALGWRLIFEPDAGVVHLSAPEGGCRADALRYERSRFHNTARFVRRHRPWTLPNFAVTFSAIAVARAWRWRRPQAVPELLAAAVLGWRGAEVQAARYPGDRDGSP